MLTPADDYLIHQTPHTFDTVFTSDRNFYDRYFFNGYRRDAGLYFALAFGTYPNLGIMDAAFNVLQDGKQRIVRGSRLLDGDRMNSTVGPISVEIIEPLQLLAVRIAPGEWDIEADLHYEARSLPDEEPHFFRRVGGVVVQDYTRMTQHGRWTGSLTIDGVRHDLDQDTWWGARDHSWGIRTVGGRDPRGAPPTGTPQFFWNWAPLNFDDLCTLYTVSENTDGTRWHESGVILTPYPDATRVEAKVDHDLTLQSGTRWISGATITLAPEQGEPLQITLEPQYHFLMRGLGYGDPEWGHGMWVGPDEVDWTEIDVNSVNPLEYPHVQTVSIARAGDREGIGVLETIFMGPHDKYGLTGLMDPVQ